MANQISKEKLVNFLKEQVEQYRSSMESYTTKGKYCYATEATYSTYSSLLTLVELRAFDENIPDGLKQLHQLGENFHKK
jgi:hypothetical protein